MRNLSSELVCSGIASQNAYFMIQKAVFVGMGAFQGVF